MGHALFNFAARGVVVAPLLAGCTTLDAGIETAALHPHTRFQVAGNFDVFRKTGRASVPIGAKDFCKRHAPDCVQASDNAFYKQLDADTWRAIHKDTMAFMTPKEDIDFYGVDEVWAYPDQGVGDCEDYQLRNRRMAIQHYNANPNQLMFMLVIQRTDDGSRVGHLVQAAQTRDSGWMVSDNLEGDLYALNEIYQKYPEVVKVTHNIQDWYDVERTNAPVTVTASSPVIGQP